MKKKSPHDRRSIIGLREYVSFPEWDVPDIVAKVDTGARTSALHVENIKKLPGGRVRFEVVLSRKDPDRRVPVEEEIVRVTRVRPSTGHATERFVVATKVALGNIEKVVEFSLVSRKHMLCRMLLGRIALEGDFLVDVGLRYALGKPQKVRKPRKAGT